MGLWWGCPGKAPTVINLGGFEAAMVGRLRDARTLPTLPQGCDDLLFGSTEEEQGGEVIGQVFEGKALCSVRAKDLDVCRKRFENG